MKSRVPQGPTRLDRVFDTASRSFPLILLIVILALVVWRIADPPIVCRHVTINGAPAEVCEPEPVPQLF